MREHGTYGSLKAWPRNGFGKRGKSENADDQEQGCHRQEDPPPPPKKGLGAVPVSFLRLPDDGQLTLSTHYSTSISHLYKNIKQ